MKKSERGRCLKVVKPVGDHAISRDVAVREEP